MALKKIYLIRHGQTGHNSKGIVQGRYVNSRLNRKGHQQARAFFEAYRHFPFQKIYTSTLVRTIETVQPFLDKGIPHECHTGFDEISWGESEGHPADGHNNVQYHSIIQEWKSGRLELKIKGGESPLEVKMRQEEAINHVISQKEDLVLICMHGRAMRIMLSWLTDRHIREMDSFDHDNLSLYVLEYEDGRFRIITHDERNHLNAVN